jgi:signal transduction histidine kinase/DNA-binding response OmpR family regulator
MNALLASEPHAPHAPRALNVDDDEAARYYKTRVLTTAGWVVREAVNGSEALALAREWMPDLVVLDVRLPDIDGLSVCRELKADPHTAPIMVLQTSATFVSSEDRVRGLEGGADHYLAQPYGAQELIATTRALYRIRRAESDRQRSANEAKRNAERLAAQNARLSMLTAAAAELLKAETIEEAFATMYSSVARQLGADGMLHYRVADDGGLVLAAHAGIDDVLIREGRQLAIGQGMCGIVARDGVGTTVTGIQRSGDPQTEFLRRCGIDHYVCMPLIAADRVVGTLSLARRSGPPFSEDEVQFVGTLASYVSIAYERIRTHHQLADHMHLLQEADRNKDEFLAMLAHELRNPLAPIVNAARLLRMLPPTGDEIARWQSVIERQSQHLTRLLDDLLDVARVSRGKIVLQREVVSAQSIAAAAVEAVMPQAQDRQQELLLEASPETLLVEGDRVRLTQVLTNLLHNAIKFTPPSGRIELIVSGDRRQVRFAVRDQGVGFASELEPHLFKLFVQGEAAMMQPPGSSGLGLGLALVRRLIELHGGRVRAKSEGRNRGAEFTVELPRHVAPRREEPAPSAQRAPESLRVLIVDDNHDAANTLAEVLRQYGHAVEALYDGAAALPAALRFAPHAILLDLAMPGQDGYETARELRSAGATASTLLIALSGYGQPRDRARSQEAGFDAHLVKPVDIEQLVALLATSTSLRRPARPRNATA